MQNRQNLGSARNLPSSQTPVILALDRMKSFAAIAASVCPARAGAVESRACPDVYVSSAGDLVHPDESGLRMPAAQRPQRKCVVLVLESPHRAEFVGMPSPAKGTTGKLIARNVHRVFGLEEAADLPLILVNAVQYQCSLGEVPSVCRDSVFVSYWEHAGRDQFVQRLRDLYVPGDLVVCACTRGNLRSRKGQLRQRVWEAMCSLIPETQILRRNHPCTWNVARNRAHEWNTV